MMRNQKSIGKEFQELFSDTLKDYSLFKRFYDEDEGISPV